MTDRLPETGPEAIALVTAAWSHDEDQLGAQIEALIASGDTERAAAVALELALFAASVGRLHDHLIKITSACSLEEAAQGGIDFAGILKDAGLMCARRPGAA